MKKYLSASLLTLIFSAQTLPIRIATYNIRRKGNEKDIHNTWDNRKKLVIENINTIAPDIIGIQEATKDQYNDLKEALTLYGSFGKARSEKMTGWLQSLVMQHPRATDEYNPIFYNKEKVKLIKSGNFGINPTATLFTAWLPRICTWGLFEDKATKARFYVYNTHLDNESEKVRTKQMNIILDRIKKYTIETWWRPDSEIELKGLSVVIMGDLNADITGTAENAPFEMINALSRDGFKNTKNKAEQIEGPRETRTGWDNNKLKIIDHILTRGAIQGPRNNPTIKDVRIMKHAVVASPEGIFPSDHRPVYIDAIFE